MSRNEFASSNKNPSTYVSLSIEFKLEAFIFDSRWFNNLSRSFNKKAYGRRAAIKSFIKMEYAKSTYIGVVGY